MFGFPGDNSCGMTQSSFPGSGVSNEPRATQYVGIDLHRRRSVIVALDEDGVVWSSQRIVNSRRTWRWRWRARRALGGGDGGHLRLVLGCRRDRGSGTSAALAHPLGISGYDNRRVKNDERDAVLLADLLRMGRLPEAWIAPREVRELREMVRYRWKLSRLQAGLKAQVHQTLGKEGAIPAQSPTDSPREAQHTAGRHLAALVQQATKNTTRVRR